MSHTRRGSFNSGIAGCCASSLPLCVLMSFGCPFTGEQVADSDPEETGSLTFTLQSSAFNNASALPAIFSNTGGGGSPPLNWTGIPDGTQELALLVTDLSQPTSPFAQWMIYKIPPTFLSLRAGVPTGALVSYPPGALQGLNYNGQYGYLGPDAATAANHRIQFTLYALDAPLDVGLGLSRNALMQAMQGHIIADANLIAIIDPFITGSVLYPFYGG